MSFGCRQSYSTFLRCSGLESFSHDVLRLQNTFPYYYYFFIIIIIMTINIKVLVNWDHFLSTHSVLFGGKQLYPGLNATSYWHGHQLASFCHTSISMTVLSISLHRICEKRKENTTYRTADNRQAAREKE